MERHILAKFKRIADQEWEPKSAKPNRSTERKRKTKVREKERIPFPDMKEAPKGQPLSKTKKRLKSLISPTAVAA